MGRGREVTHREADVAPRSPIPLVTVPGDATIVAGRRIADRYRLVAQRGDGSWDAVDETLKRGVVVQLLPGLADTADKARFEAEARALASLNHRNVVATFDTGVDGDGTTYRVDELAAGEPLDTSAVGDRHRVSFASQTARALADAHAGGLAHGRLTSGDVLVTDEGRLKVRGLRLPDPADEGPMRQADLEAVINLVGALAPAPEHPLGALARAWRIADRPDSLAAVVSGLLAIPDDTDTEALVDPTPTPTTGVPRPRRRQSALVAAGLGALALVALLITALLPGRGTPGSLAGPLRPLSLKATSFDPEANPPTENEATAGQAVDGNPATMWSTERYRSAHFGNLKDGVGLVLRAEAVSEFNQLRVRSPTRNWTFEVYAVDQPPAALAGWGDPIARGSITSGDQSFGLGDVRARALLVWITDPGPSNQVRIAELDVEGRA